MVLEYIRQHVSTDKVLDDWCYINNFDEQREPFALKMGAGEAKAFAKDLTQLIDALLDTFPAAFDNPSYQRKKASLGKEFERRYDKVISEIEALAFAQNVALKEEDGAVTFYPVVDGEPIDDQSLGNLPEELKEQFTQAIDLSLIHI